MRLLLTGASGQLGSYLLRELRESPEIEVVAWSGSTTGSHFGVALLPIDLEDAEAVEEAFAEARPDVILHAAAMARVADCYQNSRRARHVNSEATGSLALLAKAAQARLVYVSTDMVFDGERLNYQIDDPPSPVSEYGRSKAEGEKQVLHISPRNVVARLSLLYGPSLNGKPSFFDEQILALRGGKPVTLFSDEWRTPLDLATAARGLIALALSEHSGIFHLGGPERLSRLEMGQRLAISLGVDGAGIIAATRDQAAAPEPRPRDLSLDSSRWRSLFPEVEWPRYV